MKTSYKTNIRFSGFVIILVMSLVAANLTAQKSYRNFALASLGVSHIEINKYDILHTETATKVKLTDTDKDLIEDWMINPADWNKNYNPNSIKEVSFEDREMILEDWMIKANWEDNNLMEEELQLEDWMMKTDWAVNSLSEQEMEYEEWMSKPASWNSANK